MEPARIFLVAAIAAVAISGAAPAEGAPPPFRSRVAPIGESMRTQMASWHRGCPVAISDLRLVTLTYWGFDRRVHEGQLVVGRRYTGAIVRALSSLFAARFPIRRMRPVDAYGGDDHRSMAADNTSAFNCRPVSGTSRWSEHAYGRAIDINPLENPWVDGGHVSPPAGAPYANRSRRAKGMIHAGGVVVRAFAAVGWGWGGNWSSPRDYQHFSASGH
jgi:D-alanyl-D-alanine carboxypeptidase